MTVTSKYNFAVIFDMDGVIVDNHAYHLRAWQRYFKVLGKKISKEYFEKYLFGRTNRAILTTVLKRKVSDIEVQKCMWVKEGLYRKLYGSKIKSVKGLKGFIEQLKRHHIRIALATSGPKDNVQFVLEKTKLKKYFNAALDDRFVKHSKPHPEIYLRAAAHLKFRPSACVVFEDSLAGIASAKAAGMKVVGVATTLSYKRLKNRVDFVIKDFTEISLKKLLLLFSKGKK